MKKIFVFIVTFLVCSTSFSQTDIAKTIIDNMQTIYKPGEAECLVFDKIYVADKGWNVIDSLNQYGIWAFHLTENAVDHYYIEPNGKIGSPEPPFNIVQMTYQDDRIQALDKDEKSGGVSYIVFDRKKDCVIQTGGDRNGNLILYIYPRKK